MKETPLILTGLLGGREVRFELDDGTHLVGRQEDCAVCLPEPSVSRRHAEIEVRDGVARLRDLGSSNGTRVNGRPFEPGRELRRGDRIVLGRVALTVGDRPAAASPLLTIVGQAGPGSVEVPWREVAGPVAGRDKRSALFGILARAGDLLTRPRAPEDLYDPILDLVETLAEPSRALVVLIGSEGEPEIRASRLRDDAPGRDIVLSSAVVDRVLLGRASFLVADTLDDASLRARESIVTSSVRTAMAAPLFDNERVIGLLYADSTRPDRPYTEDELHAFTLLANVVAVALTHARYRSLEREKQRLASELETARRIMGSLLPAQMPQLPGWELTAHLETCSEVGGDLYDAALLEDGRLALVVGDVAGKGLGAALLVSSLLPQLRGLCGRLDDLPAALVRLNAEIWRITESFRFATFFLGLLEPATGRLVYANAGHNPPLLLRAGGGFEQLGATGPPAGMLEAAAWGAAEAAVAPGDLLVLYSDGITEAWDRDEHDYGEARLRQVVAAHAGLGAASVREAVLGDLRGFLQGAHPEDDITLVVLRRAGGAEQAD